MLSYSIFWTRCGSCNLAPLARLLLRRCACVPAAAQRCRAFRAALTRPSRRPRPAPQGRRRQRAARSARSMRLTTRAAPIERLCRTRTPFVARARNAYARRIRDLVRSCDPATIRFHAEAQGLAWTDENVAHTCRIVLESSSSILSSQCDTAHVRPDQAILRTFEVEAFSQERA